MTSENILALAQTAFWGALWVAVACCLVALIVAGVEKMVGRARYVGPLRNIGALLTVLGALGFAIVIAMVMGQAGANFGEQVGGVWTNGVRSILSGVIVAAALFIAGTWIFLTSERRA